MDKMSHNTESQEIAKAVTQRRRAEAGGAVEIYRPWALSLFEGKHAVVANKKWSVHKEYAGNERNKGEGRKWKIEDFLRHGITWKDTWQVKGDFSIPSVRNKADPRKGKKKHEERNNRRDVSLIAYNLRRTTLLPVRDGVRRPSFRLIPGTYSRSSDGYRRGLKSMFVMNIHGCRSSRRSEWTESPPGPFRPRIFPTSYPDSLTFPILFSRSRRTDIPGLVSTRFQPPRIARDQPPLVKRSFVY